MNVSTKSGIYKILNTVNGKFYVGSAVSLERRKQEHFTSLRKGKHSNVLLQRSFNKYGEGSFEFIIVKVVDEIAKLVAWEQVYLDWWEPEFNICKEAGNTLGTVRDEKTKKKLSEFHKKRLSTPEARRVMSEQVKKSHARPEVLQKMRVIAKARFSKPEERQRLSEMAKRVQSTPKAKKRMREQSKRLWANPETRKQLTDSIKKAMSSPEVRKKLSDAAKRRAQRPGDFEKRSEASRRGLASPAVREKMSRSQIGKKLSLETRQKMSEAQRRRFKTFGSMRIKKTLDNLPAKEKR